MAAKESSLDFELFVVGCETETPRISVHLESYSLPSLISAIEEQAQLPEHSIGELKVFDPVAKEWTPIGDDEPPPRLAKVRVSMRETRDSVETASPPHRGDEATMLTKVPLPTNSTEFRHCKKLLMSWLAPMSRDHPNLRVTLSKAEQLDNPELEHSYQKRRRSLHDPENVVMQPVGGSRDDLKATARKGFSQSTETSPYGKGAVTFSSDVRGDLPPSPTGGNKLIIAEVALGNPKVARAFSPSLTGGDLEAEGYDSLVVPAALDSVNNVERVVVFSTEQAIPRLMLTYTMEYLDLDLLCPLTGMELTLVSRSEQKLECMKCAVQKAAKDGYEPLSEAVAREKLKFMAHQDELSSALDQLRKGYGTLEALQEQASHALDGVLGRITNAVEEIRKAATEAGESLKKKVKATYAEMRSSVEGQLLAVQVCERQIRDMRQDLERAVAVHSDVHFHRGLDRYRHAKDQLPNLEEVLTPRVEFLSELRGLQVATVDAEKAKSECLNLTLLNWERKGSTWSAGTDDPPVSPMARLPASSSPPDFTSHSSPPREVPVPPADPPLTRASSSAPSPVKWQPPAIDAPPSTILPWEEVDTPGVRKALLAFGRNEEGQLGTGMSDAHSAIPTEVILSPGVGIAQVAAGFTHTICLGDDGRVYSFGANLRGQLGVGHRTALATPGRVLSLTDVEVVAVAAGDDHSLALSATHQVFAWGRNDRGQLGLGTMEDVDTPWHVKRLEGRRVVKIAAGAYHSVAMTDAGEIYMWGCNMYHQLGLGGASSGVKYLAVPNPVSVPLPPSTQVVMLGCGGFHTLALASDETHLYAWGRNGDMRLGLGHNTAVTSPQLLASVCNPSDRILAVTAGRHCSAIHTASGQILSWGEGRAIPKRVSFLSPLQLLKVVIGGEHSLALSVDNVVWGWGANSYGQLGLGHLRPAATPECVQLPHALRARRHRVYDVIASTYHSFVIIAYPIANATPATALRAGLTSWLAHGEL